MSLSRFLALFLFASTLTLAAASDVGSGIDPDGRHGGSTLATDGGGGMDPNGGARADYTACIDPNGGCRGF